MSSIVSFNSLFNITPTSTFGITNSKTGIESVSVVKSLNKKVFAEREGGNQNFVKETSTPTKLFIVS